MFGQGKDFWDKQRKKNIVMGIRAVTMERNSNVEGKK